MQDYPDRFRCGVSINAPSDLQQWMKDFEQAYSFAAEVRTSFFPQGWTALRASSPALNGKRFHAPVLIVQGRLDKVVPEQHARELRRAVANDKVQPEYLELSGEGHARWLPGSYVKVFTALEDFFNANIYNFSVDLGEAKEVN
jgi:dipeptidyl aminopeptidase/acylaminoacyl peptidase